MKYLAATLALALALSGTSLAAPRVLGEAQLEWKAQPRDRIIVDETIWRCAGNVCRGELVDHGPTRLRSCMRLARFAKRVVSFRTPAANLDEAELARCNRGR